MEVWEIFYLMKVVNDRLRANGDRNMRRHGLTFSQIRVLEFIEGRSGQTTQKELEDYLGVAHPTVTGLVTRLEKGGFLYCYQDEKNRRNKICCLTRKARDLSETLETDRRAAAERLFSGISREDLLAMHRMLLIMLQNLNGFSPVSEPEPDEAEKSVHGRNVARYNTERTTGGNAK